MSVTLTFLSPTLYSSLSLLFPPPLASMLPPSLRKIEEGGGGEKRAIQGERATERVLLEIFREYNMDKMSRRKTETRVKNV